MSSAIALSATRARQLQYPPEGLREDLLLLEVDDQLLAEVSKRGVVIKGDPSDTAVLCTADRTYAIKRVETTNTLLLVPPDGHRPQSAFPPTQPTRQTLQQTQRRRPPSSQQQQQQQQEGTPLAAARPPAPAAVADVTPARDVAAAGGAAAAGAGGLGGANPAATPAAPAAPAATAATAAAMAGTPGLGLQTQLARAEEGAARSLPIVARAVARAHLEVAPAAPRLGPLERLLDERPYGLADEDEEDEDDEDGEKGDGPSSDEEADAGAGPVAALHDPSPPPCPGVYSFGRLLARVQASPAELKVALRELGAVRLRGSGSGDGGGGGGRGASASAAAASGAGACWRRVDPSYSAAMLEMALATAASEGWHLDALPLRAMQRELRASGYRPRLVRHCLALFGHEVAAVGAAAGAVGAAAAAAPPTATEERGFLPPATVTPADAVGSCPAGHGGSQQQQTPGRQPRRGEEARETLFAFDARRVCLLFARRLLSPAGADELAAAASANPGAPGPPRDMAQFLARWRADVRRAAGGATRSDGSALRPMRAMLLGEALATADGGWWSEAADGDDEEEEEGGAKKRQQGEDGEEGEEGPEEDGGRQQQQQQQPQQQQQQQQQQQGGAREAKRRRRAAPAAAPASRPPDGATLRLFPADALPPDAEARFAALFAARARWLRRDLEPYLLGLTRAAAAAGAGGAATADALLLRHARASQRTPAEPVTYSTR